jgi:hypothetical protein
MSYLVKESVKTGHKHYTETTAYKRPVKDLEAAKRICNKMQKSDNQPFIVDYGTKEIVYLGAKGKDYGSN